LGGREGSDFGTPAWGQTKTIGVILCSVEPETLSVPPCPPLPPTPILGAQSGKVDDRQEKSPRSA